MNVIKIEIILIYLVKYKYLPKLIMFLLLCVNKGDF